MGALMVPPMEERPWPTLGPQICDFLEDRAVHGPGDLKGKPYRLDDEKRATVYRLYEVFPKGHPRAGKRRFKRGAVSWRKGTAKTELAAAIAFAELHPEGPVRTDGWTRQGKLWTPIGGPVIDPYIPMVAYTEEQTEDLAYAALMVMVQEGADADLFDAGNDRILRLDHRGHADGKAVALASAPDARDGARTTFQHFDETHRFTLPRLVEAHETMLQNIPKRMGADGWSLETTTTYTPGEGSVGQSTHETAELIAAGEEHDDTFFFFHRDAGPNHDITVPAQLRAAIREASGPAVARWADFEGQVEAIASLYHQAVRRGNGAYFERVWLNRRVVSDRQAFNPVRWKELRRHADGSPFAPADEPRPDNRPPRNALVTLGFDGSRWRDGTGLIGTDIKTGRQWKVALWTVDEQHAEIDRVAVDQVIDETFETWNVIRLYGDPAQGWDEALARWAEKHGVKKVVEFYTDSRNQRRTAYAMQAYRNAMTAGEVTNDGDEDFARHIGNARRRDLKILDEFGQPLWNIEKERRDSPFLIDLGMAGSLSWQARLDVIAAGLAEPPADSYAYVF